MIKRRTNEKTVDESDFINGADIDKLEKSTKENINDPKAPRKFKSHTLPLNEYEYDLLVRMADKYGQTHSGILRYALKQLALTKL